MEILFNIILLILLSISTYMNFVIYKKFIQKRNLVSDFHEKLVNEIERNHKKFINAIDRNTENVNLTSSKIDALGHVLDRSTLALTDLLETTKPIKPNNWNSIKEAFKVPTRIEVNERN